MFHPRNRCSTPTSPSRRPSRHSEVGRPPHSREENEVLRRVASSSGLSGAILARSLPNHDSKTNLAEPPWRVLFWRNKSNTLATGAMLITDLAATILQRPQGSSFLRLRPAAIAYSAARAGQLLFPAPAVDYSRDPPVSSATGSRDPPNRQTWQKQSRQSGYR
jgi:hypothetical protein